MSQNSKIVAYIDLLGFSNYVNTNLGDALRLYENYNAIIESMMYDHTEFQYFIPFSDSIFIASDNPNEFISQLSNFLMSCFRYNSNEFNKPKIKSKPEQVEVKVIKFVEDKLDVVKEYQNWFPTLFRGGVSYGEVFPHDTNYINNKERLIVKTLAGRGVVKAVGLESSPKIKGPRLICDKECKIALSDAKIQQYLIPLQEDEKFFEILWPSFFFINDKKYKIGKFNELFLPAFNLWNAYKDKTYGVHYYEFLNLIVKSTLAFANTIGEINYAVEIIKSVSTKHDINFQEVIDTFLGGL